MIEEVWVWLLGYFFPNLSRGLTPEKKVELLFQFASSCIALMAIIVSLWIAFKKDNFSLEIFYEVSGINDLRIILHNVGRQTFTTVQFSILIPKKRCFYYSMYKIISHLHFIRRHLHKLLYLRIKIQVPLYVSNNFSIRNEVTLRNIPSGIAYPFRFLHPNLGSNHILEEIEQALLNVKEAKECEKYLSCALTEIECQSGLRFYRTFDCQFSKIIVSKLQGKSNDSL